VFHFAAFVLAVVSGLLLIPLYLRFVPIGEYGAWLATGNILVWITALDPGLSTVLQQRVAKAFGSGDIRGVRTYAAGGLVLNAIVAVLVALLGMALADHVAGWVNLDATVDHALIETAFRWATIGAALTVFSFAIVAVNQGLQSSLGIGVIYTTVSLASIVVTVVLLFAGHGLLAIPYGSVVRGAGLIVGNGAYLAWRLVTDRIGFGVAMSSLPELMKLSGFTFLGQAGSTIASNADAFVVGRFLGVEEVPALVLTRKVPEVCRMVLERPAVAFMPAISHLVGSGDVVKAGAILLRLLRLILWLTGLVVGGLWIFNGDFVRLWVGGDLFAGSAVNIVICAGLAITVYSRVFSNLCTALGDIKMNSVAVLVQSLLFVPLVYFGTMHLGLLGAVAASLVSTLLVSLWYFPLSFLRLSRVKADDWGALLSESMVVAGIVLIGVIGVSWLYPQSWIEFVVAVVCFSTSYGLVLCLMSPSFVSELRTGVRQLWACARGQAV
jgi:O-antigen/teichoic acid export membrane protein